MLASSVAITCHIFPPFFLLFSFPLVSLWRRKSTCAFLSPCVKRDLSCVKRDLFCVKRDLSDMRLSLSLSFHLPPPHAPLAESSPSLLSLATARRERERARARERQSESERERERARERERERERERAYEGKYTISKIGMRQIRWRTNARGGWW